MDRMEQRLRDEKESATRLTAQAKAEAQAALLRTINIYISATKIGGFPEHSPIRLNDPIKMDTGDHYFADLSSFGIDAVLHIQVEKTNDA